ncbi:MAG: hypothetical protein KFH87_09220 [Bacteroidetes bacterium]|nr:hypothetical protein [Bacteroidota bacterium]
MKYTLPTLTLLLAILVLPFNTLTAEKPEPLTDRQTELIKKNVLTNLDHPSLEVRAGTMQLLIELKQAHPDYDVSYAVFPMMDVLKNDEKPEFRILAALTLYHLDSEVGRFAVERRAQFDSDDRVVRHCASLARNWEKKEISTDLITEVKQAL